MDRTVKTRCSAVDRISKLSSNVIDEILKYLPLRDAVRTSILSRRWRHQWTTIPYLVFDQSFKEKLLDKYNIESIVYQVLLLHKGPIVKFIHRDIDIRRPSLDHWLNFLLNHDVEYLTLRSPKSGVLERLPLLLFSFDQLTSLHLRNCELTPPSELPTFGSLFELELWNVRIKPGPLSRFIDKCPLLGRLYLSFLDSNTSTEEVKISVPILQYFWFGHGTVLPKICIERAMLLEDVGITLFKSTSPETSESNLAGFFGQLSSIKTLAISHDAVKLIARAVASKFCRKFINLAVLRLTSIDFCKIDVISCVVCLMTSFSNLRRLDILAYNIDIDDGGVKPVVEFIKRQHFKLINLECVAMDSFSCSEPEMEFVKLILAASERLEKLELKLVSCLKDAAAKEAEFRMLKELARFRRASTKAEIIIT